MNFYHFAVCHVCKKVVPNLKKCSKCHILHYCCREHQLEDWPDHKELCKVITQTKKSLIFPRGPGAANFNHFQHKVALLWQCELGRRLSPLEHQMWMFPKVCAVCFCNEVTIVCQICFGTAYCSAEHKESHSNVHEQYCQPLQLCLWVNLNQLKGDVSLDWVKCKFDAKAQCLPTNIREFINLLKFNNGFDYTAEEIHLMLLSDFICTVVNVLYALEKSHFLENRLGKKPRLVIHVVGPQIEDYAIWLHMLEFLSHWILNLKQVQIFLLGPNLEQEQMCSITPSCDECELRGFKGIIVSLEGLYQDFVKEVPQPDLFVGFNTVQHDLNVADTVTWKDSIIRCSHFTGIPVILTAYTANDLDESIRYFPKSQINFLVKPKLNPFRSLRPVRNCAGEDEPVTYQHNFVAIFTKK